MDTSDDEFEFFVRKINMLLKGKKYFWRLLMQLLMQNDVRVQFLKAFPESDSLIHPGHEPGDNYYPRQMMNMITDYFLRKKESRGKHYDSDGEINMFFITMMGFAVKSIYSDDDDNEKTINRIISLFK